MADQDLKKVNGMENELLPVENKEKSTGHANTSFREFIMSSRFCVSVLCFLGMINVYTLRVDLSVAIVCMVNHTWVNLQDGKIYTNISNNSNLNTSKGIALDAEDGSFKWSKSLQGYILGSFFYGYLVSQIPAGYLAVRFGAKRLYGWTMFAASVLTLLTHLAANIHFGVLILVRVLIGICTGTAFPSNQTLFGMWAPPLERTRLTTFAYAGCQLGVVISLLLSGILCSYLGWPTIFYVYGSLGVIWFIAWIFLFHDSPEQHPRISEDEKSYIVNSLKESDFSNDSKVPWLKILLSLPAWSIFVCNFIADWGAYSFLTLLPSYMKEVQNFDIQSNGLLSAIPYVCFWLLVNVGGIMADFLQVYAGLSLVWTRKIMTGLGFLVPAAALFCLAALTAEAPSWIAVILLLIGVGTTGFQFAGIHANAIDISPRYGGIVYAIANTLSSASGFIAVPLAGAIRERDFPAIDNWRVIFCIAAALYVFATIFFWVFASGEVQPWSLDSEVKDEENGTDIPLTSNNDSKPQNV